MSLARDDMGFLSALDALETSFVKTGTIEKKNYTRETDSGADNGEPEFKDVYEKTTNFSEKEKEFEKIQDDYNDLEIKNNNLQQINSDLEQINNAITKKQESTEEPESSELKQKKEAAVNKIKELMSKVSEKQTQITELQKEIQQTVTSLVELNVGENFVPVEHEVQQAEELKQSIIDEVKKSPIKVKKIHINNMDKDLLLAMLSLRQ